MDKRDFLVWEKASRDTIDVKRCYIDVAGDPIAGILLSQIVFLHLPGREGRSRLDITKDGHDWIIRERSDWYDECRLTEKMYDRAARDLREKGLIVTRVGRKPDGRTAVHLRLQWEVFLRALADAVDPPGNHPNGNSGIDQKAIPSNRPNGNSGTTDSGIPNTIESQRSESEEETITDSVPTLNVGELFDYASVDDVVRLTKDEKSRRRYIQLHSIAVDAGAEAVWHEAYRIVREKIQSSKPPRKPGAYFDKILTDKLIDLGVRVPVGTKEARAEAAAGAEALRQALGAFDRMYGILEEDHGSADNVA